MDEQGFVGERVRIARELAKLSQTALSRKVGISGPAISQIEADAVRPRRETVRALGTALEVPERFFTLPFVDTHDGFFRSLRKTAVAARRHARAVAHIAHDIALSTAGTDYEMAPSSVPFHSLSLEVSRADVEMTAARVRAEWGMPPGPIADVVGLLEHHGVVVIRLPLSAAAVDAFSLPFSDHPVVVLGADKNDRGRSRFDAAHELGHLVMHGEQVWGIKEVEVQAHAFAAAFLMPAEEIRGELPSYADWALLFALKERWQVSLAALLRRSRDLGVMSPQAYLSAVKTASARGWRRTEPVPLGAPERPRVVPRILAQPDGNRLRELLPGSVLDEILESID
ncbi:helix-turn-helix domain-containing protein [Pseudonocardia alni]|uniref:helix-turn-helix domain-containing protein n=1 Tax=Pseudonocardia alni TaxID=33907 RepID=UPI00372227DA